MSRHPLLDTFQLSVDSLTEGGYLYFIVIFFYRVILFFILPVKIYSLLFQIHS